MPPALGSVTETPPALGAVAEVPPALGFDIFWAYPIRIERVLWAAVTDMPPALGLVGIRRFCFKKHGRCEQARNQGPSTDDRVFRNG